VHALRVLLAVPHISHLCLVLTRDLRTTDSFHEIHYALSLLNPDRVTLLYNSSIGAGKPTRNTFRRSRFESQLSTASLSKALAEIRSCIEGPWSNMKIFDLPPELLGTHVPMIEESYLMARTLSKSPSLREVHVYRGDVTELPLRTLCSSPTLQSVISKMPMRNESAFRAAVKSWRFSRFSLIRFPESDSGLDDDDAFICL